MGRTQAKCDYKLAMLDLSQLLELSSPDSIEIVAPQGETSPTLPPLPDRIFARAEGVKPEIQAEKLRLQAAEKNIRIAKAALYPTLSLGAGLSSEYYKTSGYQAPSFSKQLSDNFNKSIGLSLNIPIFNRLATRNSIRQAKLQQSEQALQLDDKKTLYKEIQQAYYNAVNAQAKYESALAARKAAESNFNMMTGKFENGRANATELEEAKTKRANAITSTLQAKYEYILRMKIIEFYEGNKLG
ncbi:MAG: TolC family protein [Bacteroidaceae bacterium]